MTIEPISYEFIEARSKISWAEALWGYAHGHFGKDQLEKMTEKYHSNLESSANDAAVDDAIGEVRKLAALEPEDCSNAIAKKWLYLILTHLYEQQLDVDDALGQIEVIYADFDYPKEMEGFVRYMPTTDGYDPTKHTRGENLQRLMAKWERYLQQQIGAVAKPDEQMGVVAIKPPARRKPDH